jgi:uncharacterized repeat protein (TIGR01451 family)
MILRKLLAVLSLFISINLGAATISGNVYCDIDDSGSIDTGEVCPSEGIWVKLYNVSRDRWIAQEPLYPSGAYSFEIGATGDFLVFIDNNGDTTKDSTPTPPTNMLFSDPSDGTLPVTIATLEDVSEGNDFILIPDPACDCSGGDNMMTIAPIEINGDMSDWTTVIPDPDNGVCDSSTITDYDINKTNTGEIQSTGRNLTRFVWTGQEDENGFVYGYTERAGSNTNTETFIFYKDGDADGLMESGDIALVASWQGNTGTVKMEICDYVPADLAGDPMVWQQSDVGTPLLYPGGTTVPQEWVGQADGYTLHGGLTNCETREGLVGAGSADGLSMEWQVPWKIVNMLPFQPITYHVSTMNASVNQTNPPGQVDDNMGSCPLAAPVVKLDINKTADITNPRVGDDVTYTITVTNSGDPTSSVVVNDTLPAGMTYVSYSGTDWTCTNDGQDVNCSYAGVLMNGGSTSVDIVASVNDDTSLWGDTLTNNACTSSDENATQVCDQETITVYTPLVSLDINKTASNTTPYTGATIFYTIAVTNNGPDTANNVVVHDALPAGLDYVDYNGSNWVCTEVGNTVDCNYTAALNAGVTTNLFIIADVTGPADTPIINTASAHADENLTDVSDSATITPVTPPVPATLTVEKGVSNETPLTGENIIYGIIISNGGQLDATNVVFTDSLPADVTYVEADYNASLGGTFTETNGDITWSGFDLAAGESTIIRITVTVDAVTDTTVTNAACAHSDENTTDICNDANFTVRAPIVQFTIDKSVDDENPWVEDSVTYTIAVTNNGTDTANNVVVDDTLPAGVTYVSSSPDAFDDTNNEWIVGTLLPGASSELNITVSIDLATEGNLISNVATVTADENLTPVSDDANLTVYTPIVELTIQKVADQNFPPEGEEVTYTIIVNNIGDDNATGVTVTDTLPAGVTFVSAGGNGWTCIETSTVDCSYAFEIEPGFPASFDINVTVNPGTAGEILTNTACTIADQNETQVCAENSITVNQNLDLVVTKDVNNATPAEGETIEYTITVTNNGPITATGVEIIENIIELTGLTNISAVASHGSFDGNETWSIGTLEAFDTAILRVTATVASGASGAYTNFATLTGLEQDDIDPDNNYAEATITVTCPCDEVSSDGSPALNVVTGTLMILLTLMIGLFFVRREEQLNRNER